MSSKFSRPYLSTTLLAALATATIFAGVSACTDSQAKPNFVFKDAPKPDVVAKIGGEDITEEQLIGAEARFDFFDLQKKMYDLKMERLNQLVVEKLVGAEAKKANLPLEDYITKNVTKGEVKVSDQEYKKFITERKFPENQINDQVKARINDYLKGQKRQQMLTAYVAKLTQSNPVEVYFKRPKMDVQLEIGEAPVTGSKEAPVTIVEFSDFQCPFCARGADTMNAVKKKYGNKVRIAFKHFPLPMHKEAGPASEASMCVHEQKADKFWAYHDLLFKNQDKLDDASLEKYAKDVGGIDVAKFKECYASKKYAAFVQKDMEYGNKLGVKSTPTFFVNGQLVSGAVPIEAFSEIIDQELADAKK